ncbi:GNAT family N-acetyltransferase [Paracoccus sp. JM45]|uniref:GNAT family N-acetyltransferase n=1 Tax=Paracoccus sp. JM45 TaxID=2283626 RepID=UPI000E6D106E|nr:GNAT family N-acetyltransferase [Paracoccus sp. JM45]RJE80011.1 GNAT family N-acetyltransferase [Paracoccus sp. JM45]
MIIEMRAIRPEDYFDVSRIFFCAVHEGTSHAYSVAERRAWGGDTIDLPRWKERLITLTGFIAEMDGEPVGFISVNPLGYIDLAFVLPSAAGKGVGGALLEKAEHLAFTQGASCLTTAASLAARPFFEKHGWVVLEKEQVERGGVILRRYQMHKHPVKSDH